MMNNYHRQRGLTLIELMIAITLSAIITAAIASLFIQSRRSNEQNDLIARMQENGRFAMRFLREELMHADLMGDLTDPSVIKAGTLTPLSISCNSDANWYRTLTNASQRIAYNYNQSTANNLYSCISDGTYIANGNLLAIKRTKGDVFDNTGGAPDNKIYLRSNGSSATLYHFTSSSSLPSSLGSGTTDWEYYVNIFYVREKSATDTTPVLYRYYLQPGATPTMTAEPLVEDIEYFHVQFGIDTDSDGTANYYTYTPSSSELGKALSARIYVLVRAGKPTRGYTNSKTYNFGNGVTKTANDSYYRRLYTTTVIMKNPRNQRLIGQ